MSDHADHDHAGDEPDHHEHEAELERVTAPMQEFSTREVTVGFVVLLVGLVVTFGIPLALA
jgi:hypothetical protein